MTDGEIALLNHLRSNFIAARSVIGAEKDGLALVILTFEIKLEAHSGPPIPTLHSTLLN